jgi:hypothetical protein
MKGLLMIFMLLVVFNCNHLLRSQTAATKVSPPPSESPDERQVIERLKSALSSTQYSARMYFHGGTCFGNGVDALRFPKVEVLPPKDGEHGVSVVRGMFRKNANVLVSVDTSNIVRISVGNVYKPILETRLSSIELSDDARYNPNGPAGAINAIEEAAPVQEAMREYRMHQEPVFSIGLLAPSTPKLPHLPAKMKDLSLDQALDVIAKTFPGIVVYGECENLDMSYTIDISRWN